MQTVTALISRDADVSYRAFIDASTLASWVPGLRAAQILTKSRGLAEEVHFEFGARAYTLVYTYDREHREVRWQSKLGTQDGVAGYARFEPEAGATRVTYGLEHGAGRSAAELADLQRLVDAFAAWMSALAG